MVRTFLKVAFSCVLVVIAVYLNHSESHFQSIQSPDGSLMVKPYINKEGLVAYWVTDQGGTTITRVETGASGDHWWSLKWHSTNTVVLDSEDIGKITWKIGDQGDVTRLSHTY